MSFIELKDVVKEYRTGEVSIKAADGINMEINEGEFVVITGPSGAGKTTVLNILGGMDTLTSGSVMVDVADIGKNSSGDFVHGTGVLQGTGGCMALLTVGFGLKDSINSIVGIQYDELHIYDMVVNTDRASMDGDISDMEKLLDREENISEYIFIRNPLIDSGGIGSILY